MDHHLEAFLGARRDEVAGDQIELLIGRREGVIALGVSPPQPRLADLVGDIAILQLVVGSGGLGEALHPGAVGQPIGRRIQDHGHACGG